MCEKKKWNKIYEWYANDRLKNTCEAHNFPQTTRLLNEISTQFRELGFRRCKAQQHNHTKHVLFFIFSLQAYREINISFVFFFFCFTPDFARCGVRGGEMAVCELVMESLMAWQETDGET